jgi:pimeloyl-ACP methyl ester carboxylesterase
MVSPLKTFRNSRTTSVTLASSENLGAKLLIWCNNAGVTITPNSFYISTRDGISLRMFQWSSVDESPGIPILLIHGLASNARLWDGPARRLAELGHAVTAIDLRGHGLSDKPDTGYDMANIADDVLDVVNALGARQRNWARPLVLGQSWGGNIVVEYAHQYGDTIRGIVAVDGGTIELSEAFPEWELCKTTMAPPAIAGMQYDKLRSYIRAAHLDWSEEAIDGQMHNMERMSDNTIRPHLTFDRHIDVLHGLWMHKPSTLWADIKVPVMFTPASRSDDHHTKMKRAQIQNALDNLAHGRVDWFTPADHDLHAQFPLQFAGVVDDAITSGFFS